MSSSFPSNPLLSVSVFYSRFDEFHSMWPAFQGHLFLHIAWKGCPNRSLGGSGFSEVSPTDLRAATNLFFSLLIPSFICNNSICQRWDLNQRGNIRIGCGYHGNALKEAHLQHALYNIICFWVLELRFLFLKLAFWQQHPVVNTVVPVKSPLRSGLVF